MTQSVFDISRASSGLEKCPICGSFSSPVFIAKILGKYEAEYFSCPTCGFLYVHDPFWLEEAYNNPIACADTGIAQRNIHLSNMVSSILFFLFDCEGKYLDVAGGYGLFVRLMRDVGFDFFWSDKYAENLFARGFEVETSQNVQFTAATAFEILEHVVNPLDFMESVFKEASTKTLIFSTELFEGHPPRPNEWWYYSFETGQHISFYQKKTLQFIADTLGLHMHSHGMLHILTDRKIHSRIYRILASTKGSHFLSLIPKLAVTSRTVSDHCKLLSTAHI